MCLVIGILLIVFGNVFYDDNMAIGLFSYGLGGVMFAIFLYRFMKYQKKRREQRK